MPKRRDEEKLSEVVHMRMTPTLRERCNITRLSGAFKSTEESRFLVYLIEIGLTKYEKNILPHEKDDFDVPEEKRDIQSKTA